MIQNNAKNGVIVQQYDLALREVNRSQAGNYTCVASNVEGDGYSNIVELKIMCEYPAPSLIYTYSIKCPSRSKNARKSVAYVCTEKEISFRATLHRLFNAARPPLPKITFLPLRSLFIKPRSLRFPPEILVIILPVKAVLNVANIST